MEFRYRVDNCGVAVLELLGQLSREVLDLLTWGVDNIDRQEYSRGWMRL